MSRHRLGETPRGRRRPDLNKRRRRRGPNDHSPMLCEIAPTINTAPRLVETLMIHSAVSKVLSECQRSRMTIDTGRGGVKVQESKQDGRAAGFLARFRGLFRRDDVDILPAPLSGQALRTCHNSEVLRSNQVRTPEARKFALLRSLKPLPNPAPSRSLARPSRINHGRRNIKRSLKSCWRPRHLFYSSTHGAYPYIDNRVISMYQSV